jgi:hypothetical protein
VRTGIIFVIIHLDYLVTAHLFLSHLYKHLRSICFLTNNKMLISETLPCYARFVCHIASSTNEEAAAKAAAATADTGGPTM